jgi:transcriptional regulator with XRE-family HTH domain
MTERKDANMNRLPPSSLFPRNARTLALHMAMEAAQRAEIGQRIKDLRGPLPQPELARRLGVSLRAVQKWEGGDSAPQWENLVALSKFFSVSQDFLLYGEPSERQTTADSQLDRIEAKLDLLLQTVIPSSPAEVAEEAAARRTAGKRSAAGSGRAGKSSSRRVA